MKEEHIIEVIMDAHTWDNKDNPYFWYIKQWGKGKETETWYTRLSGWSKTPNDAWIDANKEYLELD